jgi:hypothetical protein
LVNLRRQLRRVRPGHEQLTGRRRAAKGKVALPASPGFDLAAVAVLKNETSYIEEWLCHHMVVGVQHFFLYDNGSEDDIYEVLRRYINHGVVTIVSFPMRGLQRDAYNHALRFYGGATEWLAYFDIDEFLVPERDETVPQVLSRFPTADQVFVSRKEFCFSGHRERPDGLVTESYTLASANVPRVGRAEVLAKSIIRPSGVWRMGVHSADTLNGNTINTAGEATAEGRPAIERPSFAGLQMNHYYTKSWEEFQRKLNRVNTSTHSYQLPEVPFDIEGETDHAIDRWVPRTKARMEQMRTLSARPYRYGSRLQLTGFPRSDQFSVQASGVVSNVIAGLERPRKQRSFDSLKMPGIRGGLARAEDHGYVATAGDLLGSVHAEHQIMWLGGEVAWKLPAGEPGLILRGGSFVDADGSGLDSAAAQGPWHVRFEGPERALEIDTGGHALRCHAFLFSLKLPAAARLDFQTRQGQGPWEEATGFDVPQGGTYLGFIAIDNRARTIDASRLELTGVDDITVYDLALVTYG